MTYPWGPAPATEAELEKLLSTPRPGVGEALAAVDGDIVILGAGGKVGPTLAMMAVKALREVGSNAKVIGVSRWSDAGARERMESAGITTHAADLSDPDSYADLPDAKAMFYLTGQKFGTTGQEHLTWWSNAAIPTMAANRYRGVPSVVYSTGNVYPLVPINQGGSIESDPTGPVGQYAQSCLAREQVFSHAAHQFGTPVTIFRLNYAVELRYGVIADIATKMVAGEEIDVTMPAVNVVWQTDSNIWTLRSLELASNPPHILNATGPETIGTRRIAELLGAELDIEPTIVGQEADTALLNDSSHAHGLYGYPEVTVRQAIAWAAEWIKGGGRQLGKATKFQQREGKF